MDLDTTIFRWLALIFVVKDGAEIIACARGGYFRIIELGAKNDEMEPIIPSNGFHRKIFFDLFVPAFCRFSVS